MEEKDKISENYRKQVDELIENKSNLNLFTPLNQVELDEIWEEISTDMDIGELWNHISSELDIAMPVDNGPGIIVKSIVAVLFILIGITPAKKPMPDSDIRQPVILIENKQYKPPEELNIKNEHTEYSMGEQMTGAISPAFRNYFDKNEDNSKPSATARDITGLTHVTPTTAGYESVSNVSAVSHMAHSNLFISREKNSVEKSVNPPLSVVDDLKKIEPLSKADLKSLQINDNSSADGFPSPSIERRKVSVGFITLFKNTWLLNYETFNGLKSESLNTTEIVFFPDAGLSLNYSLNEAWSLQADGFFYSNTGQEYFEYIYGHYLKKNITLRYSMIALSVKYKFTERERSLSRSSINLFAGSFVAVLNNADQKINTDIENITSQYRKFDLGVRIGCEFEMRLSDHCSVAPGIFLSTGIPNIYKGDGNVPGYLRKTHNGSAGFQLAFYYHFN